MWVSKYFPNYLYFNLLRPWTLTLCRRQEKMNLIIIFKDDNPESIPSRRAIRWTYRKLLVWTISVEALPKKQFPNYDFKKINAEVIFNDANPRLIFSPTKVERTQTCKFRRGLSSLKKWFFQQFQVKMTKIQTPRSRLVGSLRGYTACWAESTLPLLAKVKSQSTEGRTELETRLEKEGSRTSIWLSTHKITSLP